MYISRFSSCFNHARLALKSASVNSILCFPRKSWNCVMTAGIRLPSFGNGIVGAGTEERGGKVKHGLLANQLDLKLVQLGRLIAIRVGRLRVGGNIESAAKPLVGSDAAAAVNGASAVGHLYVGAVPLIQIRVRVVIQERNIGIVALDQAAAGREVVSGGQREAGVIAEREHGLHQALAEGGLAENPGAIMILQRAA